MSQARWRRCFQVLADGNVNVEYMYAFSNGDNAAAVIKTKNVGSYKGTYRKGFEFWEEADIVALA